MDNNIDTTVNPSSEIPDSTLHLTIKQQRFIEAYKQHGDATKAAISAGYALKSANVEGSRLLKSAKILAELKQWKYRKASEITRDDFVDMALNDYKQLDVTEPNKPRFLDIAGKTLGYIGSNNDKPSQTINNTQININGTEIQTELWEMTRKALGQ